MTSPKHQPPRPADLAIVAQRMLTELWYRAWQHNYKQLAPKPRSLLLMNIFFRIAIATADGVPHTMTSLAKLIDMPVNTLRPHVALLVKHHRVKMIASRKRGKGEEQMIIANLEHIDQLMTVEHVTLYIETIEDCLGELKRLAALLMPELVANGKERAAE